MDVYCCKCGEPWDMDSFHDEVDNRADDMGTRASNLTRDEYGTLYSSVRQEFTTRGCVAFTYAADSCIGAGDTMRAAASSALMDMMGDDLDGVASMLDDAQALGMFR